MGEILGPIRGAFLAYATLCVSLVRPGPGPHVMASVSRVEYRAGVDEHGHSSESRRVQSLKRIDPESHALALRRGSDGVVDYGAERPAMNTWTGLLRQ